MGGVWPKYTCKLVHEEKRNWLGIKPVTHWFATHTQSTEPHQPGLRKVFDHWMCSCWNKLWNTVSGYQAESVSCLFSALSGWCLLVSVWSLHVDHSQFKLWFTSSYPIWRYPMLLSRVTYVCIVAFDVHCNLRFSIHSCVKHSINIWVSY